ncbi:helix-turn-helix transcriptional regulator [Delftia acidovorans]|uniref:Helix-turn-helix transcriptional regulator n=1 Tax=Delftia acidovorans TaxID=80866 RepID=A0AAJ2R0V7_DELAC|nr:helix-turn-helix transcriptional regulator [Delftia acidovorans]MDX4953634.1 helix-turn-helix transcriptional regulator [Delftia acidovorans]
MNLAMLSFCERIQSLRTLFHFDAVQLLGCAPQSRAHLELHCEGYNLNCASALGTGFPKIYAPGFTAQISPNDLLPPSISECSDAMNPPFRSTEIYTDALLRGGFQDGMTVELQRGDSYLGMVHFSSKKAGHFNRHVRTIALGAKVLLEEAIQNMVSHSGIVLHLIPHAGRLAVREDMAASALEFSDALPRAISFMHQKTSSLQAFWLEGRRSYRMRAQRLPKGDVLVQLVPTDLPAALSAKEIQVLGWLMTGLTDREIAANLFVSERTVHSHVTSLLHKLGISGRTEAAVKAALNHWYVPDAHGAILAAVPGLCH